MTAIKICGLREAAHVQLCAELGVEFVGFVAFPKSPRHVSAEEFKQLSLLHSQPVLVTVDASNDMLDTYLNSAQSAARSGRGLGGQVPQQKIYLQAHGAESSARLQEIKSRYGVKIIKAIPITTSADLAHAEAFKDSVDLLLLDAKPAEGEIAGGNARSFDWTILQNTNLSLPYLLSGGLTPQNVAEALRISHAPMVDISSGVESSRGIKSPLLIKEFVDATRHAT